MIHPHTELRFINPEIGYGVVATQRIPRGTITWVLDKLDRTFTPVDIDIMGTEYADILKKYTYRDNRGNYVLCWDHARFVNHSFHPSSITTAYDFELAVRDIEPGEEITNDYGTLNVTEPFYCIQENGTKRKVVLPDDLLHYHKRWDRRLLSAFRLFNKVDQPLAPFVKPEIIQKASDVAEKRIEMDSILTCFAQPVYIERAERCTKRIMTKN